jgi:hypothetical protein
LFSIKGHYTKMWECHLEHADLTLAHYKRFGNERRDMLILQITNILVNDVFTDGEFTKFQIFKELFKHEKESEFVFKKGDKFKRAGVIIFEKIKKVKSKKTK